MTVEKISHILRAKVCSQGDMERKAAGCMVCDVLSQALAHGGRDMAWITVRCDMNALAVACMTGAACMILPKGVIPEQAVIDRANEEKITVLSADLSAFDLAGILYGAGLRGKEK